MKAIEPIAAVYEHGVFTPSEPVALSDGQRVRLSIEPVNGKPATADGEELKRWHGAFEGLDNGDIAELDRMILDRSHFLS